MKLPLSETAYGPGEWEPEDMVQQMQLVIRKSEQDCIPWWRVIHQGDIIPSGPESFIAARHVPE